MALMVMNAGQVAVCVAAGCHGPERVAVEEGPEQLGVQRQIRQECVHAAAAGHYFLKKSGCVCFANRRFS